MAPQQKCAPGLPGDDIDKVDFPYENGAIMSKVFGAKNHT